MIKVAMPARKIPLNYRNITGYVQSDKSSEYTYFEASLERDALILCEFDPNVEFFKTQPRRFNYVLNDKPRYYTPDIMVKYKNGSVLLVEVKYRDDLRKKWTELKPKFKAAIHELKSEQNTRFKIWTETEIRRNNGSYLKNITFLLPYRKRPFEDYQLATIKKILPRVYASTPRELIELCSTCPIEQAGFLNTLWYAIASGIIKVDLNFPLKMDSEIWMHPSSTSIEHEKVAKNV